MNRDEQHLDLLSIFHYIVGGLACLCGCFPFFYLALGIGMITGTFDNGGKNPPPPPFVGWIFVIFGLWAIAFSWAFAIGVVVAGRKLARRKNYWFCFVVACVECFFFSPLGTVLGIFTIVVLARPSVKELFGLLPPEEDVEGD